tara:strand:- start:3885 stop:5690 length:1806 start_codon:yes stop_codon:yes gene_type:complete
VGAPTAIEVSVDETEYSRYESGRDTITATVVVSGGAPYTTEKITVELTKARRSRDAVVSTATLTFTASADPQSQTAEFALPDIVDADLISLVRHGKYFVKATSVTSSSVSAESGDFDIRIVTVARLKTDYLFGIDLKATEVKAPKQQPQLITGVTLTELSATHPLGFGALNYVYNKDHTANATVAIGSGANGTVTTTADTALAGDSGNSYVISVTVPAGTSALSATLSGTTITVALSVASGVAQTADNTATLIAVAISALSDFTAVASGTGAASLSVASGPTQFSGGQSNTVRLLSWLDGPSVAINAAGTFILRAGLPGPAASLAPASNEYACARVSSLLLLPTSSVTEELLIDKKILDDETLARYLREAVDWVEQDALAVHVEPTNVVTERDPTVVQFAAGVGAPTPIFTDTDYDAIVSPLTYFVPRGTGSWVQIQTPYPQLLRVDNLYGAIANTRIIDIDLNWIEQSQVGGLIQLVPFNQEIAFNFVGLMWVNALRGAVELPNFWRFNMIVGLRDCAASLQELIAKKAAINALVVAGMALRPGVGSLSLSRDGVSESVSYTSQAQYGIYTGTISAYKDWIDNHLNEFKGKYRGPTLVVV